MGSSQSFAALRKRAIAFNILSLFIQFILGIFLWFYSFSNLFATSDPALLLQKLQPVFGDGAQEMINSARWFEQAAYSYRKFTLIGLALCIIATIFFLWIEKKRPVYKNVRYILQSIIFLFCLLFFLTIGAIYLYITFHPNYFYQFVCAYISYPTSLVVIPASILLAALAIKQGHISLWLYRIYCLALGLCVFSIINIKVTFSLLADTVNGPMLGIGVFILGCALVALLVLPPFRLKNRQVIQIL